MKRIITLLLTAAILFGCLSSAVFAAEGTQFSDVAPDAWYAPAVTWAVDAGLFYGTDPNEFSPDLAITRGMFISVLWRNSGRPAMSVEKFEQEAYSVLVDVPAGAYYETAARWAYRYGIMKGTDVAYPMFGAPGFAFVTMSPEDDITREQLISFLFRFASFNLMDRGYRAELDGFADAADVSVYAKDAMAWAVAEGLIFGSKTHGEILLEPQSSATRAEAAAILMRFVKNIPLPSPTGA